jgi:hypothetical protein
MEPKDYEDLYKVGDSQLLRQMSIQNAQMALDQAKHQYRSHSMDYEDMFTALAKRINGGSKYDSLLDRLKMEFMDYKILTIDNVKSITGTDIHYKGEEWKINGVKETNTTYEFLLSKEWLIGAPTQIKMILSRVQEGRVYSLHNDTNGMIQRVGKELLKDKNEFLKVLVGLTDEVPF